MNKFYPLFVLFFLVSCSTYEKIKLVKEYPPLGLGEPFVVALEHNKILENNQPGLNIEKTVLLAHSEDVAKNHPREKIADLKLKDHKNQYTLSHIYILLEKKAKDLGGNYVVITKTNQWAGPTFSNIIHASVYYVADVRKYELFFRWSKERNIQFADYTQKNTINEKSLVSGLEMNMRARPVNTKKKYREELLNEFIISNNFCNNCSELDLSRENLKFDYLELYQRKIAKKGYEPLEKIVNGHKYKSEFLDSIDVKFAQIENMTEINKIKSLNKEVNKQIDRLDLFKDKIVENGFFSQLEKGLIRL